MSSVGNAGNQGLDHTALAHNQESKNTFVLSHKSRCALVALVITGMVGSAIISLGGMSIFGAVGTIGFIASISGGSVLVCIAVAGVAAIMRMNRKNQTQVIQPNSSNTIPVIVGEESPSMLLAGERTYIEQQDQFRAAAQKCLEKEPVESAKLPDCNVQDFQENAKEAFTHFYEQNDPQSDIQSFTIGGYKCVTTAKIPGVVFKMKSNPSNMDTYVSLANFARGVCASHGLHLLYVPKCAVLDFNTSVVMEERVELLEGGESSQRACYPWVAHDPQLQSYGKALFKQLTTFICEMDLLETGYSALSFTKDGRIAFFDLDKDGAEASYAGLKKGVFNRIPPEWFGEFKQYLNEKYDSAFASLQVDFPALQEDAQKCKENIEQISKFYKKQNITFPTQVLTLDQALLNKHEAKVALFMQKAIEHFNKQISSLSLISMILGREIIVNTAIDKEFFKEIVNDWDSEISSEEFDSVKEKGLNALKERGLIFSFKIFPSSHFFSVIC